MPVIASTVVSVGTNVANTVAGIKDINERRKVETALSMLSAEEQRKLNEKIARTSSENERLNTLINAVNQANIQKSKTQSSRDLQIALIVIGSSLAILLTVFYITRKK